MNAEDFRISKATLLIPVFHIGSIYSGKKTTPKTLIVNLFDTLAVGNKRERIKRNMFGRGIPEQKKIESLKSITWTKFGNETLDPVFKGSLNTPKADLIRHVSVELAICWGLVARAPKEYELDPDRHRLKDWLYEWVKLELALHSKTNETKKAALQMTSYLEFEGQNNFNPTSKEYMSFICAFSFARMQCALADLLSRTGIWSNEIGTIRNAEPGRYTDAFLKGMLKNAGMTEGDWLTELNNNNIEPAQSRFLKRNVV